MHRLFVYGTLQHLPLLRQLLGRDPDLRPATVADHRAAPLRGRPYPGLLRDPGATARGMVLDVDDHELVVLDHFEGPQYSRVTVDAAVGGEVVSANAWLLTGSSAALAEPGDWDLERFVRHDASRFVGESTPGGVHPGSGPV